MSSKTKTFLAQMGGGVIGFLIALAVAAALPPDKPILGLLIGVGFTSIGMMIGGVLYLWRHYRHVD